jgi:hypothetical protein
MQPPRGFPPLVTSVDCLRLARAYVSFGVDLWDRSWRMGSGYLRRAADEAVKAAVAPQPSGDLLEKFASGMSSYYSEMPTVLTVALDTLSRDLDRHVKGEPADVRNPIGIAPTLPKTYVVDGVPVVLPVRIVDASQGWAIWMVPADKAQYHLSTITDKYTVVDVGNGRAALTILGCDYRETDLGVYREVGVALYVRPRNDPEEMPGNIFLSLSVNEKFNLIRAAALWGYSKTLAPNLLVNYSIDKTDFVVDRYDPTALSISFPRFGSGRATDIPIYTYGLGKNAAGERKVPLKTLISRSAAGQGEQVAGNVALQLGDPANPGGCVCRLWPPEINQACVCRMLGDLGLPRQPDANGWLEHMSADCSAAMVCK